MLRLFGPQNGFETGSVWTILGLLNTANPNRNFSPHNGWIGPQPGPRSAAPTPAPIVVAAGPESSPRIYDGMGSVGSNASRFQFTTSVAFGSPTGSTTGGGGGASR